MSRPLRIDVENGWYHVISRGLNRQVIYADDGDRKHFLRGRGQVLTIRTYGGMTLKQIGLEMGGMDYAAVIMRIRRYEQCLKTDRKAEKMKNELIEMLNVKT